MSTFKKGESVRQIIPAIDGTVEGFQIDQESGERLILVNYTGADGEPASRYFKESEIELTGAGIKPSAEESAVGTGALS
jgi:hypothetical protein